MDSENLCPKCQKVPENARLLPCLHLMCFACVTEVVSQAQADAVAPACPSCHRLFAPDKLPAPVDYQKPANTTLGAALSSTSISSGSIGLGGDPASDRTLPCHVRHPGAKMVGLCSDCRQLICGVCVATVHSAHDVKPIGADGTAAGAPDASDIDKRHSTVTDSVRQRLKDIDGGGAGKKKKKAAAAAADVPVPEKQPKIGMGFGNAPVSQLPSRGATAGDDDDDDEEEMLDADLAPRLSMLALQNPTLTMMVRKSRAVVAPESYGPPRRQYNSLIIEVPKKIIGKKGSGVLEFKNPVGVAATPEGQIIVADFNNNRLVFVTPEGEHVHDIKLASRPHYVAVNPTNGDIWVALHEQGAAHCLSSTGTLKTTIPFNGIIGVAVNKDGTVFVTDGGVTVAAFDSTGKRLWLSAQMVITARANGLAVTDDGEVIIAVHDINRLLVLTAKDGKFVRFIGPSKIQTPLAVALTTDGHLIVSESQDNSVSVWTLGGIRVHKWGRLGRDPGEFNLPGGVAVLPDGRFVVADYYNNRIQLF